MGERLVKNDVREVMGLGVIGREHIICLFSLSHNKDSDLRLRLKWEAIGEFIAGKSHGLI